VRKQPTIDKARIPFGIEIWNDGDVPAENILVSLEFSEDCELFETKYVSDPMSIYTIAHVNPNPTYGGLHIDDQNENIANAWIKRLGNDRGQNNFEKIYVKFNTEKDRTFEINGTVIQDNYPKTSFTFKVHVKPKVVEETRYKENETQNHE
jgi:hypothetical protein